MKVIFLVFLILALFLGYTFYHSTNTVSAPTNENVPTTETLPEATEKVEVPNEPVSQNEHVMPDGTIMGNDAQMEFPTYDDTLPDASTPLKASTKTFTVLGSNFVFDIKEIRVKKGDVVTIIFGSTDGFHDFVIDEFNAKTERLKTGGKTSITFTADKIGTYKYYCSVGSHRMNGMVGNLIVE